MGREGSEATIHTFQTTPEQTPVATQSGIPWAPCTLTRPANLHGQSPLLVLSQHPAGSPTATVMGTPRSTPMAVGRMWSEDTLHSGHEWGACPCPSDMVRQPGQGAQGPPKHHPFRKHPFLPQSLACTYPTASLDLRVREATPGDPAGPHTPLLLKPPSSGWPQSPWAPLVSPAVPF